MKSKSRPARSQPTPEAYAELQRAYDHFNDRLFGRTLPGCLITLQREKRTCGYFSKARFANLDGLLTDEIALNPAFFAVVPLVETLQTMVHEMVHQWQAYHGSPGRGRYHNDQWADKMESIGLMPSSTGQPGGRRTGDHMADYAIEGGRFLKACKALVTDEFQISWYDRFPAAEHVQAGLATPAVNLSSSVGGGPAPAASVAVAASLVLSEGSTPTTADKSNRVKYSCSCVHNVWGKPGLRLKCMDCGSEFLPPRGQECVIEHSLN
jgi:predicted SprT family Zn-dependent metalloprotease